MKIDKQELHELFKGIKEDSKIAFEVLYKRYNPLVYKIAFSILKNKENSEDVMQNVFTKIYQLPVSRLPERHEASWLYTVAKNEAITKLRSTKENFDIETVYNVETPNNEIEKIIEDDKYNKIIDKLSKKEQEIVSLKILGELSFSEIAKLMNMPIGTVQWHYYKALNDLKLLIGNISMLIITFVLYLKNAVLSQKKVTDKIEKDNQNTEIEGEDLENKTSQEETIQKNENTETDAIEENKEIANEIKDNNLENNKGENIEENVIGNNIEGNIEADIIVESNAISRSIETEIFFNISSIFLISTIIFGIICIKHQQNKKKKASK